MTFRAKIEENGSNGHLDSATLSALAAGEMSAARELARRVGGETRPRAVLLEGNHRSIYFSEVDEETFLLVVCDGNTSLGLLRLRIRESVSALKSVFQEAHIEEGERLELNLDRLICTEPQRFP